MKVGLTVVVITVFFRSPDADTVNELNTRFYLYNKTMDYPRARRACQLLGAHWSLPDGQADEMLIKEAMINKNITSVWSKVVQKRLNSWIWNNNNTYSRWTDPESGGCGVLNIHSPSSENDEDLSSHMCSDTGLGFICSVAVTTRCLDLDFISIISNKTYMVGCSFKNWFKARQYCQSCKGTLAVISKGAQRRKLRRELIEKRACHNYFSLFYVGLHIEDWVTYNAEGAWVPLLHPKWLDGEPQDVKYQCTILQREMNHTGLKVLHCYQKRHVLCLKDVEKHESKRENNTDMQVAVEDCSPQESEIFDLKVICASVTCSLLILLIPLSTWVMWRCAKYKSKAEGEITRKAMTEEKKKAHMPMLFKKTGSDIFQEDHKQ